ncbi:MAG: hypothetical protein JRD89_02040 [Deltaproteobacteria bacterium]|nr:hypothetical protein [Deltaproteobacteria bacterium]
MKTETTTNYVGVILQLRWDDGEWIVHDPRNGDDDRVDHADGTPVARDEFFTAGRIAQEMFPGCDLRLV